MRLQHKTAIITGGGTGIGKAIALSFADEGANIAICGRRKDPLEEVLQTIQGGREKALLCTADISSSESVGNFVDEVLDKFGTVDILVNNAGVVLGGGVLEATEEEWDQVLSIDLKGAVFMSQAILPRMVEQESGKIIHIASIAGIVAFPKNAAYAAAKGALIQLTHQMALDYAPHNINVNAIAPGIITTDMTKTIQENEEMQKSFLARIPLGRFGTPEDIAKAAIYLASNESDFITGQTIVVDGGWTIQ